MSPTEQLIHDKQLARIIYEQQHKHEWRGMVSDLGAPKDRRGRDIGTLEDNAYDEGREG